MADDAPEQQTPAEKDKLDLSSLSSLSLGPDWISGNKQRTRLPRDGGEDRPRPGKGPRRDRRGPAGPPREHSGRPDGRPARQRPNRTERPPRPEIFEPVVEVDFYPEEEPFKVLAQAIRNSCRTFELFEIARLILDKPDRFVCVVRDPEQKEGEAAKLFASVPDGLPFRSEDEALAHSFRHYLSEFFTVETVEVEPPQGAFQMVHKCGITGDLLAPPNYHRFQAICREHHASKLSHLPYSRFEQKIVSSREQEDVQAWLTQMKTQTRYTAKENPETTFDNLEDARLFLLTQSRDKLIRPAYSARFSGKALALLNPQDPIRRSVEFLLERQKRFPLETANHLRGRLRRMHFAVYKKGSKGISFVCAVKRRFRKPNEVLADNLLQLIQFVEDHPNFPAKDLPKAYLGIDPDKAIAPAPAAPIELPEKGEGIETPGEAEEKPEAPAAPSAAPVALTKEQETAIRDLKNDLHYLVSQGYVIEYSDGRLYVPPIREDEIRHHEKELAAQAEEQEAPEDSVEEASTESPEDAEQPEEAAPVAKEEESAPVAKEEEAAPVAKEEESSPVESEPAVEETSPKEADPAPEEETPEESDPLPPKSKS